MRDPWHLFVAGASTVKSSCAFPWEAPGGLRRICTMTCVRCPCLPRLMRVRPPRALRAPRVPLPRHAPPAPPPPAQNNFDNTLSSCLTLFQVATLEGYVDIMHMAMDTVGTDQAMRENANPWAALFFMTWIMVGSFFVLNLFVGMPPPPPPQSPALLFLGAKADGCPVMLLEQKPVPDPPGGGGAAPMDRVCRSEAPGVRRHL